MVYIDPQLAGLTWTVADEPDLCLWICAAGFVLALLIQCLAFCYYIGYNPIFDSKKIQTPLGSLFYKGLTAVLPGFQV